MRDKYGDEVTEETEQMVKLLESCTQAKEVVVHSAKTSRIGWYGKKTWISRLFFGTVYEDGWKVDVVEMRDGRMYAEVVPAGIEGSL